MPVDKNSDVRRRRRGTELEDALLSAAWDELVDKGYDAFTIESAAARAGTSRAVLYRRWPSKPDLVRAALVRNGFRDRIAIPDTGSLRSDLIAILRATNKVRLQFAMLVTTRLGAFYAETGTSFADLRDEIMHKRNNAVDVVFERAVERGEADPAKLTPRVRRVAFDLYRHEMLMTQRPVPNAVIESIVDDVVLPLVTPDPGPVRSHRRRSHQGTT